MSIWISKVAKAGFCSVMAMVVLAGCQPSPRLDFVALLPSKPVTVLGDFKVGGPRGYCTDKTTLQETEDTVVALLGRCSANSTSVPAMVAVTVGRGGSAGVMASGGAELYSYFASDGGRKALSRRGRAADVKIANAKSVDDIFLMHIQERGQGDYWRGMVTLRGRLISVSATGPQLPARDGLELVQDTVAALRRANRR